MDRGTETRVRAGGGEKFSWQVILIHCWARICCSVKSIFVQCIMVADKVRQSNNEDKTHNTTNTIICDDVSSINHV